MLFFFFHVRPPWMAPAYCHAYTSFIPRTENCVPISCPLNKRLPPSPVTLLFTCLPPQATDITSSNAYMLVYRLKGWQESAAGPQDPLATAPKPQGSPKSLPEEAPTEGGEEGGGHEQGQGRVKEEVNLEGGVAVGAGGVDGDEEQQQQQLLLQLVPESVRCEVAELQSNFKCLLAGFDQRMQEEKLRVTQRQEVSRYSVLSDQAVSSGHFKCASSEFKAFQSTRRKFCLGELGCAKMNEARRGVCPPTTHLVTITLEHLRTPVLLRSHPPQ